VHDGLERLALVRLPKAKAQKKGQAAAQLPAQKLPLVIFLHGAGGSARQAMQQTGLDALAERAGFIAVFPEGLAAPQGQEHAGIQTWNAWTCCGYARDQKADDVGFLAALISRLKADYPVDPRRVFLAGFSNGAMLASRFALERPGIVASIASVAGYLPCDAQTPQEPLPVLVIHGSQDHVARFGPTEAHPRTGRFCEDFPAKAQVEFWVRGLGLPAKAQQVQDGKKSRVRVERYGPGKKAGRGLVEFVIVKGGGHAWPGGARERYRYCDMPTPDPDATALVWDFFKRQARPGAPDKADKGGKGGKGEKPGKADTPQKPAKKSAKTKARG
jgi:polyhydroxybutyrate depolymerase